MTAAPVHIPMRTCVGCRQRDRQAALVRVAGSDDGPSLDPRRRLSGRGAYVHIQCLDRALDRGGIARGLRASVSNRSAARLREQLVGLAGGVVPSSAKERPEQ